MCVQNVVDCKEQQKILPGGYREMFHMEVCKFDLQEVNNNTVYLSSWKLTLPSFSTLTPFPKHLFYQDAVNRGQTTLLSKQPEIRVWIIQH